MPPHQITIDYGSGGFSYTDQNGNDATDLDTDKGDPVTWTSDKPFGILFKGNDTPCDRANQPGQRLRAGAGQANGRVQGVVRQNCNGNGTSYDYYAVVYVNGRLEIDDPAIIVH